MFSSFEIKTYPQLNFALGLVNALLLATFLVGAYFLMLTPQHVRTVDDVLSFINRGKILDVVSIGAMACLWGWIATYFLRLHDRLHEPRIRKWRAMYNADFILRSLLADSGGIFSQELFDRAYADKRICNKLMQRIFYNFMGDETQTAPGSRMFFYAVMWKYWSLALVDLYAIFTLLAGCAYGIIFHTKLNPWLIGIAVLMSVFSRMMSNKVLDEARGITVEQIAAIKSHHGKELLQEATAVATELCL